MPKRPSKFSKRSVKRNRKTTDKVSGSKKKTEAEEAEESDKPLIESSTVLQRYKQMEAEIKHYNPNAYDKFRKDDTFNTLIKVNPTIFYLELVYNKRLNGASFIESLLKDENVVFASCFQYYLHFKDLVKGHTGEYPIIEQLIKHGFNTIFDILLENDQSFYLSSFLAHIGSFDIVENANEFLVELKKNKLYTSLRKREVIEALQKEKLYTRLKKYQV